MRVGSFDARRSDLPYLADLGTRCVDIMLDEIRRNESFPGGVAGQIATNIQSTVEVHDGTTIDPGLISISMDYGYMRAFDVLEGGAHRTELMTLSDAITTQRMMAWKEEYEANGIERVPRPRPRGVEHLVLVPSKDALLTTRDLKVSIFNLAQSRSKLGGAEANPDGAMFGGANGNGTHGKHSRPIHGAAASSVTT